MSDQKAGSAPPTIRVGLTTVVLGERFRARCADLPPVTQAAWWERTDYAWACTACPDSAGVMYKTPAGAKRGADAHATKHPGAKVVAL